jgi:6-methylsalicylic acid synthase
MKYQIFPLSAASDRELRQRASRLAEGLGNVGLDVAGQPFVHEYPRDLIERAVVAAASTDELAAGLRRVADGEPDNLVVTGQASIVGDGPVWVFSGHGSQWPGMGRDLLGESEFAAVIDALEPVFSDEIGFSPREAIQSGDFQDVAKAQTMIFAMQVGLAALWRSRGVHPAAIIGHSVGEIAAAVCSGMLSLADGGRLICRRSRLLRRVAGRGGMAMVMLSFADVQERLSHRDGLVAAIESAPTATVIAGVPEAIDTVVRQWQAEGIAVRRISSDVAFHSPQMEQLVAGLEEASADLCPGVPAVPVYSTALPDPRAGVTADGKYWAANLRNPVRLATAITAAAEDGFRDFLEVSPHPVVTHSIGQTLTADGTFVAGTLRRGKPERLTFLKSAAAVYCRGFNLAWSRQ